MRHRRQGCQAGHPGHGRTGGVQRHEGAVHEVGRRLPARLFPDGSSFIRRNFQLSQTNPEGQRQGRISNHLGRQ